MYWCRAAKGQIHYATQTYDSSTQKSVKIRFDLKMSANLVFNANLPHKK